MTAIILQRQRLMLCPRVTHSSRCLVIDRAYVDQVRIEPFDRATARFEASCQEVGRTVGNVRHISNHSGT